MPFQRYLKKYIMGIFDLFKKKKTISAPVLDIYKRYWLSNVATIELPEEWEVSYIERFQAKSPNGKSILTIITYKDQEQAHINQAFFEDLKLDFYQEYQEEGFEPLDEPFISDQYIGKSFLGENEIQYHFTTAKNEENGVLVTEFLLRSEGEFNPQMRDFLHKVGQSLQYVSDFSRLFVEKLQKQNTAIDITFVEGLEVRWTLVGVETTTFLDNAYAEYMNRTSALDEILDRYVTAAITSKEVAAQQIDDIPTNEQILPLVKDRKFIEQLNNIEGAQVLYDPINTELFVIYAVNGQDAFRYLTEPELQQMNLSREELKIVSVENLINQIEVGLQEEENYYLLVADGNFEASFLLIPEVWTKENFPVQGNIVVAVPSRSVLMVTGSQETESIKLLKEKSKEILANSNHIISDKLFELHQDEGFVVMN